MSVTSRPSFLRTTIGRTAVAGAATLVSVMGVAPAALAADGDVAPDTQELDPPAEEQAPPGDDQPEGDEDPTGEGDPTGEEESTGEGDEQPSAVAVPPVASPDSFAVTSGENRLLDVLKNDGVDAADVSSVEITQPQHGAASLPKTDGASDWRVLYEPTDGYEGPDSFTYTITTADGTSAPTTVTLDVEDEGEEVEPIFGDQKYLVGVQIKDGSYVEDDATTAGSVFRIRTTVDGVTTTTTCTAQPVTPEEDVSFCPGESEFGGAPFYTAPAGATVSVTQTKAGEGLTRSTETKTLEPCTIEPGDESCTGDEDNVLFFENVGPLPRPVDDRVTTDEGDAISIDVLRNDTSNDPATELTLDSQPENGTAEITGMGITPPPPEDSDGPIILAVPAGGSQRVLYTPEEGFTGTDRFTYELTNSNGSATADVFVRVVDGTVVSDGSAALPDTGGADVRLLGLGGLLATAGALLVRGRRRTSDLPLG